VTVYAPLKLIVHLKSMILLTNVQAFTI